MSLHEIASQQQKMMSLPAGLRGLRYAYNFTARCFVNGGAVQYSARADDDLFSLLPRQAFVDINGEIWIRTERVSIMYNSTEGK